MALNLTSVTAKLGRAREHAQAVEREILPWMDPSLYSTTKQVNADCTRYSLIFHATKEPPFERWALMAGECIHNLRCALDHLAYAIAIHESGGQDPPPNAGGIQFPICDCKAAFEKEAERRLKPPIRKCVVAAIEAVQPYNRWHPVTPPMLSILRDFNNTDKHKLLKLAYGAIMQGDIGFVGPDLRPGNDPSFVPNYGELKEGAEIMAITFPSPAPDMQFDRHNFTLVFAVHHGPKDQFAPEYTHRSGLPGLLGLLTDEVATVIDLVTVKAC